MKTTLLRYAQAITCAAALSGTLASEANAAPVEISFGGLYHIPLPDYSQETHSFTATIQFDSDLAFSSGTNNNLVAGGDEDSDVGSITVNFADHSETVRVHSIFVSQNDDQGRFNVPPTHRYIAGIIFSGIGYSFYMTGYGGETPFTWGSDLLPTQDNPIPFSAPDVTPSFMFLGSGPISFDTITGYNVVSQAPVPVPAALWLFGTGLIGLGTLARQRRA